MKKTYKSLCIILLVCLLFTACGNNTITATEAPETIVAESSQPGAQVADSNKYDVDLTQLSSTMVYSEVYNMFVNPDNYMGKSIKMTGLFSVYEDELTGNRYFSCIIEDATACCAQGIEFVLQDAKYPEDYPAIDSEITVSGIMDMYFEEIDGESYMYLYLKDAQLI